ncbi:unnamed protein product [Sordaria macrospora k-hell]|uniref:WGS project CABT00000000 data, contig 2.319 n=1 Tax=Sordaria macrospora (strain ATCC MYA-333 / DSM 997 / K(L3346) / K-hell) TaxID=771870 RepID=F7WCW4_SORMK|nr:unnamed protein product [Sordaria macrospora k-hell]
MFSRRLAALTLAITTAAPAFAAEANAYPDIPEPMVFDMVRPMSARRGELETNVLALSPLSGQERALEWAPEVEYAVADGFALEIELPFEGTRLAELKMGAQATFGTMDRGRIVHGVQFLGIYERESKRTSQALLYMLGRRHNERLSTMTMVGVGDVRLGQSESDAGLLVNHSTFYDLARARVVGLEVNYKSHRDGGIALIPQFHAPLADKVNVQLGAGADRQRGEPARPVGGVRLIKEF